MIDKTYDFRPFIQNVVASIKAHELECGHYRRWLLKDDDSVNPYGCADACNILYSVGAFPREQTIRDAHVAALQQLQDPETGMFHEATHHSIHTTAHCLAALELFDASGLHPLKGIAHIQGEHIGEFLSGLDWSRPWGQSHQGAGIYAAKFLQGEADTEWKEQYFTWLWENACPDTGYWRKGDGVFEITDKNESGIFPYLASAFHYLFNLQHAHQALRYPEAMIDSGLRIFEEALYPSLGSSISFAEIDWVYCQTRALRQCGHRFDESMTAIRAFADRYLNYVLSLDFPSHERLDDLHALFGCICCLAELQQTLPGVIITEMPLKLVLDRRPFI